MNVSTFAGRGSDTDDTDAGGSDTDTDNTTVSPAFVLPLLGFAAYFALKTWVVKHNQVADKELRSAGQRLASETGLHAEYRSENTGVCKSKGSQIFRGFVIFPGAVIGAAQAAQAMMAVTVPANAGPGTALQVAAPSGQTLQVVVPPGLGPGQVFQVQLPPAQPVMATAVVVENVQIVDARVL